MLDTFPYGLICQWNTELGSEPFCMNKRQLSSNMVKTFDSVLEHANIIDLNFFHLIWMTMQTKDKTNSFLQNSESAFLV